MVTSTESLDTRAHIPFDQQLKEKLIRQTSLSGIVIPMVTVAILHFVIAEQGFEFIVICLGCSSLFLLNYLVFVRRNIFYYAASFQSLISLILFSVALFFTGGMTSAFTIYAPLLVVNSAFLNGKNGIVSVSVGLIILTGAFLINDKFGILPVGEGHSSPLLVALNIIFCIGSIARIIWSYEKIRKRNEFQLKQSEDLLRSVIDNIPLMVIAKDYKKAGQFYLVNQSAEQFSGITRDKYIGKTIFDFAPKDQADLITKSDFEVFTSKAIQTIDVEEIIGLQDKKIKVKTWNIPTFDSAGNPHLMIRISMNITEELKVRAELDLQRAKAVQMSKLASLGEMCAGIAHEINNPLAIIYGSVELLSKYAHDPEKLKFKIDSIEKSAERISKIVNGLRKFSRSSEKVSLIPHSLLEIIQETLVLTEATAKRGNTSVTLDCPVNAIVKCNEVEIEQVLINLINNAIDAVKEMPERWVKISLMIDGPSVVLRIMDSGPGIPEEVRDRMFEPFFTTKAVGEGTGLGLSITQGILNEHKATISLLAQAPHTCFEIRFPFVEGIQNAT